MILAAGMSKPPGPYAGPPTPLLYIVRRLVVEFLGQHPDPCGWQTSLDSRWPALPLFPPHVLVGAETLPPAEAQQRVRDARLSGRYFTGF